MRALRCWLGPAVALLLALWAAIPLWPAGGAGAGAASPAQGAAPAPSLVLFGWDGARRERVRELLSRGELPNLARLAAAGSMVDIDVDTKTDTKAGWTEILTGCGPERTGVYSNAIYRAIPEGLTVFERYKAAYGAAASAVAVMGKKGHLGGTADEVRIEIDANVLDLVERYRQAFARAAGGTPLERSHAALKAIGARSLPPDSPLRANLPLIAVLLRKGATDRATGADTKGAGARIETAPDGKRFFVLPAEPYHLSWRALDEWLPGLGSNDSVGAKALEMISKYAGKPLLLFVHFADVDHQGHAHGESSAAYTAALRSCDQWTGRILEELGRRGYLPGMSVYLVPDHGFDPGARSHSSAPTIFLASTDRSIVRGGNRRDVGTTLMAALSLAPGPGEPALDGRSLLGR